MGGESIPLGGARQRAVLAVLLTHAGEVVSGDRLIDELWGDDPPETAANVLQGYVSHLRKALGRDAIATRDPGYVVEVRARPARSASVRGARRGGPSRARRR